MKLTVIGGGGVRSLFLAKSIAGRAEELNITELTFMDIDSEKLNIFGTLAKKTSQLLCPTLKFVLTTDKIEGVKDADYIITTIRAGGDEMRVKDERIALSRGILGQETTGAAGFSFALRSVPALVEYLELSKIHSKKNVKIFNFTNPVGIVSQALHYLGYENVYGICDAPTGMLGQFAKFLNVKNSEISGECYGLNHLSFFNSILVDNQNVMEKLINDDLAYEKTDLRFFDKQLLTSQNEIFNEYAYYYYYREKAIENILHAKYTRSEKIAQINEELVKELKKIDIENDFETAIKIFEKWYGERENNYMASETGVRRDFDWKFDIFSKDDGGYAGVALKFIEIEQSNKVGSMILCTLNKGAISGLEEDDIVEINCDIVNGKCVPHKISNINKTSMELVKRVKHYERLGAKAIIAKDKKLAVEALFLHPLVNSYSIAREIVDEYFALNFGENEKQTESEFVAGVGRTNIDLIYKDLPRWPNEGEEVYSKEFCVELGGGAPATLIHLSRLGIPIKIATQLGGDIFSKFASTVYEKERVKPLNIYNESGFAVNVSSTSITSNDRTFISYGDEMQTTPQQLQKVYEMSCGAKIALMQYGYLEVYKKLKKEGVILIFDLGYDDEMSIEKYREYLILADYFTPNKLEAMKITNTKTIQEAGKTLSQFFDKVIIKLDDEGCYGIENNEEFHIDGIKEYVKVDSTGAGDAFLAGLTYGIYNGFSFKKSVLCGNIVGGKCVTQVGCLTAKITIEELNEQLKKYEIK